MKEQQMTYAEHRALLEKLEPDTLRDMVIDLSTALQRIDELVRDNKLMKSIIKAGMVASDTPPGEHWHLAACLAGLVEERDKMQGIMRSDISSALDDCVELGIPSEQMREVIKTIIAKALQA